MRTLTPLLSVLLSLLLAVVTPACGQPAAHSGAAGTAPSEEAGRRAALPRAPHHVIGRPATIFMRPDSSRPYLDVDFREPLYLLEENPRWSRVRTADGAEGYVRSYTISNIWVRVSKREGRVYLYEGTHRLMAAPADFGYNAFLDKQQRGSQLRRDDWRTPEGTLYIVRKNPHSRFDRALVLNYPTAEDAERGLENGLITAEEHREIVAAQKTLTPPPMDTALGGMIEIHGKGTGAARNWTHGCVALHNRDLRKLWNRVEIGTPVVIE